MLNKPCPSFEAKTEKGETVSNSSLKGSFAILYFYPKDDTPGCTIEAGEFQKLLPEFAKLNCKIFGISKDSEKSHKAFIEKNCLEFPLLMDEQGTLCNLFGTMVEKSMYGKQYMGISRDTFLITPEGKIGAVWKNVSAPGHAKEVYEKVKELKKS